MFHTPSSHAVIVCATNEIASLDQQIKRLESELSRVRQLRLKQVQLIQAIRECYHGDYPC